MSCRPSLSLTPLEDRTTPDRTPVLILHGILGSWTPATVGDGGLVNAAAGLPSASWGVQRGADPEALRATPFPEVRFPIDVAAFRYYQPLIESLEAAGYVQGKDLFVANYDWRLPVAADDGTPDGRLSAVTAASLTDARLESGVDYLGYWLDKANRANGGSVGTVNVVAHSMGNLVTRAYIQSAGYGGEYTRDGQTLRLPTINQFVAVSPPFEGSPQGFSVRNNDLTDYPADLQIARLLFVNPYQFVAGGGTIPGPDRVITQASIAPAGVPDERAFIDQYLPSLGDLVPTYPFVSGSAGGPATDINADPAARNDLLLDLNGGETNGWVDAVGHLTVAYGTSVTTPTAVTQNVGPGGTVTSFLGQTRPTQPGEVWYRSVLTPNGGDGVVPLESLVSTLEAADGVTLVPFSAATTAGSVEHAGILTNPDLLRTVQVALQDPLPTDVFTATGSPPGGPPRVTVRDESGAVRLSFDAFDPAFTGGVSVATADLTGDGVPDVVAAPGPGGGPHVKAFDGATGTVIRSFLAYEGTFRGGVNVAVGDLDADGVPDILTGAGAGGGPRARVFSGATGAVVRDILAYDPGFRGGVFVAAGDANGDGTMDLITGVGFGGGPHVKVFDGATGNEVASEFAYDASYRGGLAVLVSDADGDGDRDLTVGPPPGGPNRAPRATDLRGFVARAAGADDPFTLSSFDRVPPPA